MVDNNVVFDIKDYEVTSKTSGEKKWIGPGVDQRTSPYGKLQVHLYEVLNKDRNAFRRCALIMFAKSLNVDLKQFGL